MTETRLPWAMTTPDYFLWVLVPKAEAAAILKKFNLNPY